IRMFFIKCVLKSKSGAGPPVPRGTEHSPRSSANHSCHTPPVLNIECSMTATEAVRVGQLATSVTTLQRPSGALQGTLEATPALADILALCFRRSNPGQ